MMDTSYWWRVRCMMDTDQQMKDAGKLRKVARENLEVMDAELREAEKRATTHLARQPARQ